MLNGEAVVFPSSERPAVLVRQSFSWRRGTLLGWLWNNHGWHALVEYPVGPGQLATVRVAANRVRPEETDSPTTSA
jgi:hypothetical protein